jgi:type II secretory pathway pseudopilin PulG
MFKKESGFTLVETLVALLVGTTMIGFVIPLYLTGKSFYNDRMLENQARVVAQAMLEEHLSMLKIHKTTWRMRLYSIEEEVTYSQPLWNLKVIVKWKNSRRQTCMVKLETRRFQSVALPTLK